MPNESILRSGDVRRDASSNRLTKLRGQFPLIEGDAGASIEDRVRAFLTSHSDELQLQADSKDLILIQNVTTPTRRILRYQQTRDGIPIDGGVVLVQLDLEDYIRQVDIVHDSALPTAARAADTEISGEAALQAAINDVGSAKIRLKPEPPRKIYYPVGKELRLAYEAMICTTEPPHDYRYVIDAFSGAILAKEDILKEVDGQGFVFDSNPVVTKADNTLRDPDAAGTCGFTPSARATLDAQRVTRTLKDITLSGGVHKLEGPFCKMRNFGTPNISPPEEANANNFKYGSGDNRFDDVNVYYHVDTIQRYIQSLGITNANNRQTECDAHDGVNADVAFYSPVDKGLHFGDSGPCKPDRAEDGEVMLHEYGHAIQDNQVPGWGSVNPTTGRFETGAMGEGFGDALACCFFAPDHNSFQRETFEDWVWSINGAAGLRRVDGTKVYPADWTSEVHNDGEIWSAALWNIYRAIGGDSLSVTARREARDALLKTVILSHFSVPANGTMPDAAEAVMETNAELDDFLGKHLMQMLDSFHARGILSCNPNADLWIREAAGDPGANNYVGPVFWDSPDLWIRNANDNGTTHQNPEFGQDNWFYAQVRNRGTATARAFVVTFNVKPWAGVQFTYPNDFIPFISATVGFNLAPGASMVVKAKWPNALVPPAGTHACWLAQVYTPVDKPATGNHVWESNDLAQKNLSIVDLVPGDSALIKFQIGNLNNVLAGLYRLEVNRPANWTSLPVSIVHADPAVTKALFQSIEQIPVAVTAPPAVATQPGRFIRFLETAKVEIGHRAMGVEPLAIQLAKDSSVDMDRVGDTGITSVADFAASGRQASLVSDASGATAIAFQPGALTGFPIALPARTQTEFDMKITAPADAKPGDEIKINLVQRDDKKQVVGGITVQVNVRRK
jgi:Zn-dependent metalloprotease